jgi:hypothetical protein
LLCFDLICFDLIWFDLRSTIIVAFCCVMRVTDSLDHEHQSIGGTGIRRQETVQSVGY